MTTLLAGDIGGTKTLLALYRLEGGRPLGAAGDLPGLELLCRQRYPSAEWSDLAPMVRAFLASAQARDPAHASPAAACLAVAGPVEDGRARLTNLRWTLEQRALAAACDLPRLELMNDFAVLPYGLPHLRPHQMAVLHPGRRQADAPLLVLGAGTGLGVAFGLPTSGGLVALASEAAHGEFAPRTAAEWDLKTWLAADLGIERVSIERVVSGTGLGHVARWMLARQPREAREAHPLSRQAEANLPAAVSAAAAEGDPLASQALDLWLGAYGSVCGDLALAALSRGGIWLAGGTAAKQLEGLRSSRFRDALLNKGRLRPVLEAMPVHAVVDPDIGAFSAACRAAMVLAPEQMGHWAEQ